VLSNDAGAARGAAPSHAGGAARTPLDALLPAPDPDQVWVTDFAPSPDYASDHTVYMLGQGNHCYLTCSELFRSTDGGVTWTYVPSYDLAGTQLLVPESGYSGGRQFFAAGGDVLQVTRDGGAHFDGDGLDIQNAVAAPAWLGAELVTADAALSFVDGSQVPHPVAVFPAGDTATGPPLLMQSSGAGGFVALQAVLDQVLSRYELLSCTGAGCTTLSQIPVQGPTIQLVTSPDFAADRTVVAIGGGVAVSHDGGASFVPVSREGVAQAIAVPGPHGMRLVAVDISHALGGNLALSYSDDLGATWRPAGMPHSALGALYVEAPRLLAPGRVIASAADPAHPGMHVFVCSADGALWSACSPQ